MQAKQINALCSWANQQTSRDHPWRLVLIAGSVIALLASLLMFVTISGGRSALATIIVLLDLGGAAICLRLIPGAPLFIYRHPQRVGNIYAWVGLIFSMALLFRMISVPGNSRLVWPALLNAAFFSPFIARDIMTVVRHPRHVRTYWSTKLGEWLNFPSQHYFRKPKLETAGMAHARYSAEEQDFCIPGLINGHEVLFRVDTGCDSIAIPLWLARELKLSPYSLASARSGNWLKRIILRYRRTLDEFDVRLDEVKFGDICFRNVRGSIQTGMQEGVALLGMSVLTYTEFNKPARSNEFEIRANAKTILQARHPLQAMQADQIVDAGEFLLPVTQAVACAALLALVMLARPLIAFGIAISVGLILFINASLLDIKQSGRHRKPARQGRPTEYRQLVYGGVALITLTLATGGCLLYAPDQVPYNLMAFGIFAALLIILYAWLRQVTTLIRSYRSLRLKALRQFRSKEPLSSSVTTPSPANAAISNGINEVVVPLENNSFILDGQINGRNAVLMIDTGANYVYVPKGLATQADAPKLDQHLVYTAYGTSNDTKTCFATVRVGGLLLRDVVGSIAGDLPDDEPVYFGISGLWDLDVEYSGNQLILRHPDSNTSEEENCGGQAERRSD